MRFIFDLDHTVIDSSHRQLTRADGSLDLDHWIENNTRAKIMRDKLLPLARHWRESHAKGAEIVVCTARVIGEHDLEFLRDRGLFFDAMLSRPMGDDSRDADLKARLLASYAKSRGYSWRRFCQFSLMFDDNKNVIEGLQSYGLRVYNALEINERLAA